jgi:hypothetical protein
MLSDDVDRWACRRGEQEVSSSVEDPGGSPFMGFLPIAYWSWLSAKSCRKEMPGYEGRERFGFGRTRTL